MDILIQKKIATPPTNTLALAGGAREISGSQRHQFTRY